MALCELHWKSNVLMKQVAASVILPEMGEPPFRRCICCMDYRMITRSGGGARESNGMCAICR